MKTEFLRRMRPFLRRKKETEKARRADPDDRSAAMGFADRVDRGPVARGADTAQENLTATSVDDTLDRTSVRKFINTYKEERLGAPPSAPIEKKRSSAGGETAIELPPEGAEDEMDEGTALDYDSDEFFDAVEDPAMRSTSILLDDYQKSTGAPDEEHRWGDSDTDWQVRGKKYLKDKVKVSSAAPAATLLAVDLAHSGGADIQQMTAQPQSAYECTRQSGNTDFLIIVNWRCPPMHVVNVFGMKDPHSDCLFQRFLKMDKDERNQRLKVVPFCPEGPWLARTAIGSTPVIIGNKIDTEYFDGPDYLEISINVFSSSAAKRMMNVVCGVAKKMVIDVALVIEGRREDELPERVLGAFRVIRSDITKMRQLDAS
eukprot:GEMP01062461.1.p1 GENE.GEMP01062461.1~~GEMP01062461.1.p1  ORF type:complete len:373 (+),score=69.44 GEMP01062461.1:221-1339(+)